METHLLLPYSKSTDSILVFNFSAQPSLAIWSNAAIIRNKSVPFSFSNHPLLFVQNIAPIIGKKLTFLDTNTKQGSRCPALYRLIISCILRFCPSSVVGGVPFRLTNADATPGRNRTVSKVCVTPFCLEMMIFLIEPSTCFSHRTSPLDLQQFP